MFSTIKQMVFSSRKNKQTPYSQYCDTVSEKIKQYDKPIDDYIYENGGQVHLERVYNREPNKKKYTDFYGYILFKVLEEKDTHKMNTYVKKHGFDLLIHQYLETEDDVYTYYDVYGNRTKRFNDWILSKAYIEQGKTQEHIFSEQYNDIDSDSDEDDDEDD